MTAATTEGLAAVAEASLDAPPVDAPPVRAAPRPRPRRPRGSPREDRPCRACRHYDCLMDRGEPLPDHVRAYQDGERYHDAGARARAREEAIRVVDGRRGYSIEYASDPAAHEQEWRDEEARILAREASADGSGGGVG